jgi:glycosyltransferase involved in cell wall biosynthesis
MDGGKWQVAMLRPRAPTLLLFTQSYPFAVALEDTFLEPELPHLRDAFDRVIVIPSLAEGARAPVPDGIEVDESLAAFLRAHSGRPELVVRACFSRLFRSDVAERPGLLARRGTLSRLAATSGKAELTRRWITRSLAGRGLATGTCVAYTFWCEGATAGLALVKRGFPDLVVVSRAHGADLYADRYDPPYLPCRGFTLRYLDRLLPDSDRGVDYVAEHHAWFASRCEIARMGVTDPGFATRASAEGRFTLVSCSRVVPIKRVDLILRAVDRVARSRPDIQFEWHHFGGGPLKAEIEAQASATLGSNASAHFPGYSSLDDLFTFYRTRPVDVFLNASISEGTPVSIMEAISCGIPIVATAVGGNPEIVSHLNGTLVGPNPEPDEIAAAVMAMISRPDIAAAQRQGSRRVWASKYNAAANYSAFARLLLDLRASI